MPRSTHAGRAQSLVASTARDERPQGLRQPVRLIDFHHGLSTLGTDAAPRVRAGCGERRGQTRRTARHGRRAGQARSGAPGTGQATVPSRRASRSSARSGSARGAMPTRCGAAGTSMASVPRRNSGGSRTASASGSRPNSAGSRRVARRSGGSTRRNGPTRPCWRKRRKGRDSRAESGISEFRIAGTGSDPSLRSCLNAMSQLAAIIVSQDEEFRRQVGCLLRAGGVPVGVIEDQRAQPQAALRISRWSTSAATRRRRWRRSSGCARAFAGVAHLRGRGVAPIPT